MHMQNFRRRPDLDWFCLASIGPRLGPLAFTVTARLRCFLALLLRRATRSSLEHGRSQRGHVLLGAGHHKTSLHFLLQFLLHFCFFCTLSPALPLYLLFCVSLSVFAVGLFFGFCSREQLFFMSI